MRTLPVEMTAELTKDFFCFQSLFIFEWSTTHYWTSYGNDIYYNGNWYLSKKISYDHVSLSLNPKIDSVTVNIDDVGRKMTKIILSENIQDKRAWIYLLPLDKNIQPLGSPTLVFFGYTDAASRPIGSKEFSIKIYNDMIKWKRLTPRRITTPTCIWDFKDGPAKVVGSTTNTYTCILDHCGHPSNYPTTGANWATYWTLAGSGGSVWVEGNWYTIGTCRYSGAEIWCDRSWDRCSALGNTINYGGFKYLPNIIGKQIYWGQSNDPTTRWLIAYLSSRRK
jgi:hypothetical protein